ncbi:hypothetical protein Tco_0104993 [Tanacetum coccineum]
MDRILCRIRLFNSQGKEIAKPISPSFESAYEEDSDSEQAQRDKDMQKNLALVAKYFKKLYKPTNNNLRTSSKSKNKNVDTTLRLSKPKEWGCFQAMSTVIFGTVRQPDLLSWCLTAYVTLELISAMKARTLISQWLPRCFSDELPGLPPAREIEIWLS